MTQSSAFRWIVLLAATLFGAFCLLAVLVGSGASPESGNSGFDAGMVVFFGLLMAGSWFVAWRQWQGIQGGVRLGLQNSILRLALAQDGHLTLHDVCASLPVDVRIAQATMDDFVAKGLAETSITEDGVMVYEFPKALDGLEKRAAKRF